MTQAFQTPTATDPAMPLLHNSCPHCGGALLLTFQVAEERTVPPDVAPAGDCQSRQQLRDSGKGKPTCPLCGQPKGLEYKICARCYDKERAQKGVCQRCGERRCSPGYTVCYRCAAHDPADDPEYGEDMVWGDFDAPGQQFERLRQRGWAVI